MRNDFSKRKRNFVIQDTLVPVFFLGISQNESSCIDEDDAKNLSDRGLQGVRGVALDVHDDSRNSRSTLLRNPGNFNRRNEDIFSV